MRRHVDTEVSVLFLRITLPWPRWVFPAVHGLSLVAARGGCSRVAVPSLVGELGLQACEPQ